jgi:hypothetical protein
MLKPRVTQQKGGDEKRRVRLAAVWALLAVALLWLAFTLAPVLRPHRKAQALDTPGWTLARELDAALHAKPAFLDASFAVVSENPLKLRLAGGVRTARDLKDLQDFVKRLRPDDSEDQLEVRVEILNK